MDRQWIIEKSFPDVVFKRSGDRVYPMHSRYRFDPIFTPIGLAMMGSAGAGATAATVSTVGMMTVGTAIGVTGGVISAISSQQQGKAMGVQMDYQADMEKQRADIESQKMLYSQKLQAEESERYASSMLAGSAAGGAKPSEGSELMKAGVQAAQAQRENLMMGWEAQTGQTMAESAARGYRMQGDIYRTKGRNEAFGSYMGAGGTLLTGFSKIRER